ncbi:toxin glutamine deamidase domain-containing protein [Kitasatospora sp. NPDC002040]|uniref:toxin glutamine deamidase domain-containing protein n=1 Tax=Kitasatospora sp. NPDC002040 TaxID=3154661 RepID=UPI00333481D2
MRPTEPTPSHTPAPADIPAPRHESTPAQTRPDAAPQPDRPTPAAAAPDTARTPDHTPAPEPATTRPDPRTAFADPAGTSTPTSDGTSPNRPAGLSTAGLGATATAPAPSSPDHRPTPQPTPDPTPGTPGQPGTTPGGVPGAVPQTGTPTAANPGTPGTNRPTAPTTPSAGPTVQPQRRPDHDGPTLTPRPAADRGPTGNRPDPRTTYANNPTPRADIPSRLDPNGSNTPRPATPRPDTTRPDIPSRLDPNSTNTPRPEAPRPDLGSRLDPNGANGSNTPRPDTTRPDLGSRLDPNGTNNPRPDTSRPDGNTPDIGSRLDPNGTNNPRPDTSRPDGNTPDIGSRLDPDGTNNAHPDTARPDSNTPDIASRLDPDGPDTTHPDTPATPDHERPLADSRPYDTPGGLDRTDPQHQQDLESRVPRNPDGTPQRHPDPNGDWPGAVNGDGHRAPGRDNNCLDVALSTADTYSGNPTAAAPRNDTGPDGEQGGRDRAERQLGAPFRDMGDGDQAFKRIEDQLRDSGHGSQAVIVTQDANGRAHAWNVVNHDGKITYLDNQTGQRSDKPLHNGDNGVFAVSLDPDRRPIPADDGSRNGTPESRGDGTDRRPADPAGKQKHDPENGDAEQDGPPHKKQKTDDSDPTPDPTPDSTAEADANAGSDPERESKGSAEYDTRQDKDQTHYGMEPDKTQQNTRTTNEVTQTNTESAHQFLEGHIDNGQLAAVLDEAAQRAHGTPPQLGFDKKELGAKLPGFNDLSRGEQGAVVAAMGRLSLGFHEAHAVGASPEHMAKPYENDPTVDRSDMSAKERKKHVNDGAAATDDTSRGVVYHASQDFRTAGPPSGDAAPAPAHLVREHLVADPRFGGREGVYELASGPGRAEHKPDFSGKNFAVIEVVDSKGNSRYVVDSSIPRNSVGRRPEHSEPHLGRWVDRLNESSQAGDYKVVSLYTEREPCGNKPGHAGCSNYIAERLPGVAIDYGVGYRKGAQTGDGTSADSQSNMTRDAQADLNRLGTIWARMAKAEQL